MKALVLYRSHYGTTKSVAGELAKEFQARGIESEVADMRRKLPPLGDFDAVLVGAPTRMARVTRKAYRALKRLSRKGWGTKPVIIFDTYGPMPKTPEELEKGKKWLYPGAAGLMKARAEALGLSVYAKTLRLEVAGLKGPLKAGEDEKIGPFVEDYQKTI